MAGIVNDVGDEVVVAEVGFVKLDPDYFSTPDARRSCFAPLHQGVDDRRRDISVEPNQIRPSGACKVNPPRHTR